MPLEVHPTARALIFDVDGTLADTMPAHYEAWCEILGKYGVDYPLEMFNELAGMPTRAIVPMINRRFGLGLDPEATAAAKERVFLRRLSTVRPIVPVVEIVCRFHGRLPLAAGSGGRRELVHHTLDAIGIVRWFDVVVTAEDVTHHKPAPDTFLLCAERLGVAPAACQVFEDGDLGIEAGYRAGMMVTDIRPFLADNAPHGGKG